MALEEQRGAPVASRQPAVRPSGVSSERLESRLGLTLVNRIGAVTLAVGMIFFFKYAVDNRWIGAPGRVILGLIAGLAFIGLAEWLRRREQTVFSQGVCGCGLAIIYVSLYASFAYYQLIPEAAAFVSMAIACVLAVIISLRYESPAIAVLGLVGAFLTPILLRNAQHHLWLLFIYLLFVDSGSLIVSSRRSWPVLYVFAFAGTAILFLSWASEAERANAATGVFFLCALFTVFFAASLRTAGEAGLSILPLNAFWAIFAVWILLHRQHPGWVSIFALGVAIAHFATAYVGSIRGNLYRMLYVIAHGCLLTACLRELDRWGVRYVDVSSRTSFLSEGASMLLAIYALLMISAGAIRRARLDRAIGLVLLGIVIFKLYLYDVWLLTRFYRISAFIALGILLLAASYIYSRFREKVEVLWSGNSEK